MMVQIVEQRAHVSNFGDLIIDREGYIAQFTQNDITDDDVLFAERVFTNELGQIHGSTVLGDEVTPTPFLDRVSVFDTEEMALREQWDTRVYTDPYGKEIPFKQYVEQFLSERARDHSDFREMHEAPVEPPWPKYMDYRGSLDQLIERLVEDGHDLRQVIRFEEQTGHRQAVIEKLREVLAEQMREMSEAQQVPA